VILLFICIKRYLKLHGFKVGRKKLGQSTYVESEHIVLHRLKYIRAVLRNRRSPPEQRRRVIYMDESYIHTLYNRVSESYYDPSDERPEARPSSGKGERINVIAAIAGPNPNGTGRESDAAHLIFQSVYVFDTKRKPKKKKTTSKKGSPATNAGEEVENAERPDAEVEVEDAEDNGKAVDNRDYHSSFDSALFLEWMKERLLPFLDEPSIIVMDNAGYHTKKMSSEEFVSDMTPEGIKSFLWSKGMNFDEKEDQLVELKKKVKDWYDANKEPLVAEVARQKVHEVYFTPPYHCDLQPIEMLWSKVKGKVGRNFVLGTTTTDVMAKTLEAFKFVCREKEYVGNLIEHTNKIEDKYEKLDKDVNALGNSDPAGDAKEDPTPDGVSEDVKAEMAFEEEHSDDEALEAAYANEVTESSMPSSCVPSWPSNLQVSASSSNLSSNPPDGRQ